LRATLLALASASACLDPNPDFDGEPSTTDGGSADDGPTSSPGESTSAPSSSSSETSATCEPDGFEPNDEMEAQIPLGEHSMTLETVEGRDLYNVYFEETVPESLWMAAGADVEVCAFIECEGTFDPPQYDCVEPAQSGSNDEGTIGCCGRPELAMTWTCAPQLGAKLHLEVRGAAQDCTHYTLELTTTLP
jgi:hypothetical protein